MLCFFILNISQLGLFSLYAMAFFGMQPLGGLLVGFVSQHIGVQDTVLAQGVIALLIGGLHFRFLRKHNTDKSTVSVAQPQVREAALQV